MTSPRQYLMRMAVFVIAVLAIVVALWPPLEQAFLANQGLNGLIIGVLALGIAYIFRQVFALQREVNWIEGFRTGRVGMSVQAAPRLIAPMAAMLGERTQRFSLSAMTMRSLLDGIAARLDEQREISRYLIGLLIFLGLLGTFWGLLQTITSVGAVISGLSVGSGDLAAVFADLKKGLREPLTGMGTAFSSSLFGLAGSLVLGFLELQAGQAQNRFYNDLEDWLSGQARLGGGALSVEGDHAVPAYVQALLERTADGLDNLQRVIERGEESRISANNNIAALAGQLAALTDQMRTGQELTAQLAESQLDLKPALARLIDGRGERGDEGARGHIRSIDLHLARLHEELAAGRTELIREIRAEIRVLARTLAAVAEGRDRPAGQ